MKQPLFNQNYLSQLPIACQFITATQVSLLTVETTGLNTNLFVVSDLGNSYIIVHPPYKVINPKKTNFK
jgi:hypothetical protein